MGIYENQAERDKETERDWDEHVRQSLAAFNAAKTEPTRRATFVALEKAKRQHDSIKRENHAFAAGMVMGILIMSIVWWACYLIPVVS